MHIHILGGFLGSGKTTLLMRLANRYIDAGRKVAVLVNEMGDIGVDGMTLAAEGYNTLELPDGCVCCSLSAELQIAVRNVRRDIGPDIMLIEPTGLAVPGKIVRTIAEIPDFEEYSIDIIGVVDPVRFRLFVSKKEAFMLEQLTGASMVLVNKMDVAPESEVEYTKDWIGGRIPGVRMCYVSARTGDGMAGVLEEVCDE